MPIVKCPKCGKGHMKQQPLSVVGNKRLKLIVENTGERYNDRLFIRRMVCSRCGYIEGIDGT